MIIRAAVGDDHDAIATVWQDGWRSTNLSHWMDPSWESLRARIPKELANGWSLHVGEKNGLVVGMLAFRPRDSCLDQVFVAPNYQGKGLGRQLLNFARQEMPDEMWLRCAADNIKAWQWYEREGFYLEKEMAHETSEMPLKYYRWRRT